MNETSLIFPSFEFLALEVFLPYSKVKSKSSGERYPSSTIPQMSLPFTRSSLHESQTSLSMIVSLKPSPKSGREKDTSPVLISILTDTLARNLTFLLSITISFLIAFQSSLRGMNFFTNLARSSLSNSPSSSSNFLSSQSRMKAGRLKVEKKFVFFKSL